MKKDPESMIDIIPPALRKRAEEAEKRLQSKRQSTEVRQKARQEYLPFWPDEMRCLPNEILRSALFNAKNRKQPREHLKDATIYMVGGGKITYTGEELRQDDEIVWLQLIHLAKEQSVSAFIEFTPYSFCKSIRWSVSGQSYARLKESLKRMHVTGLSVYSKRLAEGKSRSMIPAFDWKDNETTGNLRRWRVQVAPELVEMFGGVHFSRVEWETHLELPVGLATWLHGYFASHKEPYPIKIETIKKGAGLTTEDKSHLMGTIASALHALKDIRFLSEWSIDGDLVSVKRTT